MAQAFLYGQSLKILSEDTYSTIVVTAPAGSAVTCALGEDIRTATESSGTWTFEKIIPGAWVITATLDEDSASETLNIDYSNQKFQYSVTLAYSIVPEFTFVTADTAATAVSYELTEDEDGWEIKCKGTGALTFSDLKGVTSVDVFCVGGGGGGAERCGGGGGYTKTLTNIPISTGTSCMITVGSGGYTTTTSTSGSIVTKVGQDGGSSSFVYTSYTCSADGGKGAQSTSGTQSSTSYTYSVITGSGGAGGSGGSSDILYGNSDHSGYYATGKGGALGDNGVSGYSYSFSANPNNPNGTTTYSVVSGGTGQGSTTRAFNATSTSVLDYARGGNSYYTASRAYSGDGGSYNNTTGQAGCVIIRNHR